MIRSNRIIWIVIFLSGTIYMTANELADDMPMSLGWFLFISLWSALCAIGFSIFDWFFSFKD